MSDLEFFLIWLAYGIFEPVGLMLLMGFASWLLGPLFMFINKMKGDR